MRTLKRTIHRTKNTCLGLSLFWLCCGLAPATSVAPEHLARLEESTPARPKLVVVLAIDQFRGDFPHRFADLFGPHGFRRLQREGFDYDHCFFETANTETGPGHAAMLSGAYADQSGIVQNEWFDQAAQAAVYCVSDTSATILNAAGPVALKKEATASSPRNLMAETLGDVLKAATGGRARVISLSLKDRAAILMGGRMADLAVWFDRKTGDFVTSDWYCGAQPAWLIKANRDRLADAWCGTRWELALPPEVYAARCTPDDAPGEFPLRAGFAAATFPHALGSPGGKPDAKYFDQLYTSPSGNDLLVQLAFRAIDAEKLGADATPDLLTISFSSNDPIGHTFGPDSWETLDAAIRTDRSLAELLHGLDDRVGEGNWTLFLTADHGVANMPEVKNARHATARRVDPEQFADALDAHLRGQFKGLAQPRLVLACDPPWVSLAGGADAAAALIPATLAFLRAQPEVAWALPVSELTSGAGPHDAQRRALRNSYYPGRCGQVAFQLRPYYVFSARPGGAEHGSAYRYDQHVPLLACGAGIRHGRSSRPAEPIQIAPTISAILGIENPAQAYAPPLEDALRRD